MAREVNLLLSLQMKTVSSEFLVFINFVDMYSFQISSHTKCRSLLLKVVVVVFFNLFCFFYSLQNGKHFILKGKTLLSQIVYTKLA